MNNFWLTLEADFARVLGSAPRPIAPVPASVCPQRELPDDRSDETRDAESTGV